MKKIDRILDKVTEALCIIGSIGLAIVILIVLYNVIARGIFERPYAKSYEVVQYGALACVLLGLTRTTYNRGHIQVSLVIDKFPWRVRDFFNALGRLLNGCIYLFAAWLFIKDMPVKAAQRKVTDLFRIPMQWIDLLFVIFLTIAALIFIWQTIEFIVGICGKNDPQLPPEPPIEGIDSFTGIEADPATETE